MGRGIYACDVVFRQQCNFANNNWILKKKDKLNKNARIRGIIRKKICQFLKYCIKLALHVSVLNFQQTQRTSCGKISAETHTQDDYQGIMNDSPNYSTQMQTQQTMVQSRGIDGGGSVNVFLIV